MHHAAVILEAHDHLVVCACYVEDCTDLLAQGRHGTRFQVTLEVHNETARPFGWFLAFGLILFLALFRRFLLFVLRGNCVTQRVREGLIFLVQVFDFQTLMSSLPPSGRSDSNNRNDCGDNRDGLQQE